MNRFILFFLVCLFSSIGWSQNGFVAKSIEILPSSELSITGVTNINKFGCQFNTDYLEPSREVFYKKTGTHISFRNAILSLRNEGFDCGNKGINKDFHSLLKTNEYPKITLELTRIILEDPTHGTASVKINIADKERSYKVPIEIDIAAVSRFIGKLKLDIRDFGLMPPKKMLGLIIIKEEIEIDFNLVVVL